MKILKYSYLHHFLFSSSKKRLSHDVAWSIVEILSLELLLMFTTSGSMFEYCVWKKNIDRNKFLTSTFPKDYS